MAASSALPKRPRFAAILPVLRDDAKYPLQIHSEERIVLAAYNPARDTRDSVWDTLVDLFGPLLDVSAEVTA